MLYTVIGKQWSAVCPAIGPKVKINDRMPDCVWENMMGIESPVQFRHKTSIKSIQCLRNTFNMYIFNMNHLIHYSALCL